MIYRLDPNRRMSDAPSTAIATRPQAMVRPPKARPFFLKNPPAKRSASPTPGEGSAPLSNNQKANICILAKDAWIAQGPDMELEDWRHEETRKAIGAESLRVACQDDYLKILSHFQRLAGETERAAHSEIRYETGPRRTAWAILCKELVARGLQQGYAAAICTSKFKRSLGECSHKQLWVLIFDVRSSKHPVLHKPARKAAPRKTKGEIPF